MEENDRQTKETASKRSLYCTTKTASQLLTDTDKKIKFSLRTSREQRLLKQNTFQFNQPNQNNSSHFLNLNTLYKQQIAQN